MVDEKPDKGVDNSMEGMESNLGSISGRFVGFQISFCS